MREEYKPEKGRKPQIELGERPYVFSGPQRPRLDVPVATLIIDINTSKCNACGGDASPEEKSHESLIGWWPSHEQGCGVVWTHVTSNYVGSVQERAVREMRPDLIWQEWSQ